MSAPLTVLIALAAMTVPATATAALAPAEVAHRANTAAKALLVASGLYGLLIAAALAATTVQ